MTNERKYEEMIKVLVIGDPKCGKTSLLYSLGRKELPEYIPCVFETICILVPIDEKIVPVYLDRLPHGVEDYDRLRPLSYPYTDIFLVCFSIDNPASLENAVEKWASEIGHYCPQAPMVLVGTKKDMRDGEGKRQHAVRREHGMQVAKTIGAIAYFECSTKPREGVDEIFQAAVQASLQKRKKKSKAKFCNIM